MKQIEERIIYDLLLNVFFDYKEDNLVGNNKMDEDEETDDEEDDEDNEFVNENNIVESIRNLTD